MEESIIMNRTELITMSPLVLAYLGDTVFESHIKYVNAKAQATIIHNIEDQLTEDELRIYKRGRNQKSHTSPKNADIIDYKHATGFEALIGYLYLDKNYERLEYIISEGIKIIEANM